MIENLFSTPLFVFDVVEHADLRAALIQDIDAWRTDDPHGLDRGLVRSTWESKYTATERPAFQPILHAIEDRVAEMARPGKRLTISGAWANVAEPAAYRTPHYHANAHWAAIYYLSVPEGAPGTTFLDPRGSAPHVLNMGFSDRVEIPAKEGRLVVFPVFLAHYVGRHRGIGDRITISCNLIEENE